MSTAPHKRSEHITVFTLESDAASYAGPSVEIRLRTREPGSLQMPTKEDMIETNLLSVFSLFAVQRERAAALEAER